MDPKTRNNEIIKTLADNITLWRLSNDNLSKRKLGNICLISESTIRNLERKTQNTRLRTLVKLRLGFDVELKILFEKNPSIPKVISTPLQYAYFESAFAEEKFKIGKRLTSLQEFRGIDAETLSLLSYNIDYSDTLKYQRGEENIELFTLLKYADGLEVDLSDILNYNGGFPNTIFKGKMKE